MTTKEIINIAKEYKEVIYQLNLLDLKCQTIKMRNQFRQIRYELQRRKIALAENIFDYGLYLTREKSVSMSVKIKNIGSDNAEIHEKFVDLTLSYLGI